jgi:hypothetical protein
MSTTLLGVDFTSAPRAKKPISCAWGVLEASAVRVTRFTNCPTFETFHDQLMTPGPWVGAFDMPFGLPRAFVAEQGWSAQWLRYTASATAITRQALMQRCRDYAAPRPAGAKLAYRATDKPAGSSSAMWWMNPPVVLMYHAGIPCLLRAGVSIVPCRAVSDHRTAVEAYPGLIQKRFGIGSYKQDITAKQTPAQRNNRQELLKVLTRAAPQDFGFALTLTPTQRKRCVDDASGDTLDAVLCLVQAAFAAQRADQGYGLPRRAPRNEGWIVMA